MSGEVDTLYHQAMTLTADERYQLARDLLYSLLDAEIPDDPEFWEEIGRRSDEANAHPDRLIDAKRAISDMRDELARRRAGRAAGSGA